MLFTTAAFAFVFLPIALAGFFALGRISHRAASFWLLAASVFFYGYWMPKFTVLLLGSIAVNYLVGRQIGACDRFDAAPRQRARRWLVAGLIFNLGLLGYFKYMNFFVDSVQAALGVDLHIARILLPIGISFFTFTQIAFLADAYQKGVREYQFGHYGLFVTYFPHLIAGPVLHHAQMMPQFEHSSTYRPSLSNLSAGFAIFGLGLLKKVVIADGVSGYADAVFSTASAGHVPTFMAAWLGALAYTFQLYFDFSGYSDMAVGLSWMFNVRLPFNFDSPYKAGNIIDFWRRWHMTLSAFLRDYLYIPLGGNRHGPVRRYVNLAITMLLGGLWHGASWTFVFWGGLHGAYLGANHAFRALAQRLGHAVQASVAYRTVCWLCTFLAVVVAWVFFRAPTFGAAGRMLRGMAHAHGPAPPFGIDSSLWNAGLEPHVGFAICLALAALALAAPNSNVAGQRLHTFCASRMHRGAFVLGFAATLVVLLVVLNESRSSVSAFIYFNF